jgi:hypothetical protein
MTASWLRTEKHEDLVAFAFVEDAQQLVDLPAGRLEVEVDVALLDLAAVPSSTSSMVISTSAALQASDDRQVSWLRASITDSSWPSGRLASMSASNSSYARRCSSGSSTVRTLYCFGGSCRTRRRGRRGGAHRAG